MKDQTQKLLLQAKIITHAKELGFDLIGFSKAKIEEKYLTAFKEWIEKGLHGDMSYMEKVEQRADLSKLLPNAKSVIVLAVNYYYAQKPDQDLTEDEGRVARYAFGRDYHKVIGKKLKQLEKFLSQLAPSEQFKSYVDTGPVLERALAEQAGIGKIGKNTCLITPQFGSWVFLSEIITTLDLAPQTPPEPFKIKTSKNFSACGNCNKCVTACPTGAIISPGVIDSRLCISYLTIENKGPVPPHLKKIIQKTKRLYGCDICQEVCPHNSARQKTHANPELTKPIAGETLSRSKITKLNTHADLVNSFAGSPILRAKISGLRRNFL